MIPLVVLAASPVVVAAFTALIGRRVVDSTFDGDDIAAEDDDDAASAAPSMDMEMEVGHANATKASKC